MCLAPPVALLGSVRLRGGSARLRGGSARRSGGAARVGSTKGRLGSVRHGSARLGPDRLNIIKSLAAETQPPLSGPKVDSLPSEVSDSLSHSLPPYKA